MSLCISFMLLAKLNENRMSSTAESFLEAYDDDQNKESTPVPTRTPLSTTTPELTFRSNPLRIVVTTSINFHYKVRTPDSFRVYCYRQAVLPSLYRTAKS